MFFRKITSRSNGKEYTYLKLIENYREGDKVKQRVVANLGSLENLTPEKVQGLISGLSRICGVSRHPAQLEAKKVLRYGEVLAIHQIWEMLRLGTAIEAAAGKKKNDLNVPLLVELMALNQIIKPQNKQAISEWYQCLYLPELEDRELPPQHFYRALDVMAEIREEVEKTAFSNLSSLLPVSRDLAFCRLTASVFEPSPREDQDVPAYGRYILEEPAEQKRIDYGIMVTRDGMPFGHKMLQDIPEEWEYRDVQDYLRDNFGIEKCIFVGERSVMANPNLELLVAHGYNYLIGRKYLANQDRDMINRELSSGRKSFREINEDLWFKEVTEGDVRYLLCFNPRVAEQREAFLQEKLDVFENELKTLQQAASENRSSIKKNGLRNSPVLKDSFCRKYFEWDYNESNREFVFRRKSELIAQELKLAGMFLLETNSGYLGGAELLEAYTGMAQLGESFREIKSFEVRPNQLHSELNISANIFVCVLAAMMEKTLERLIRRSGLNLNSRQALDLLEEIKVAVNQLDDLEVKSVTRIQKNQEDILRAIGIDDVQRTII